jgi:hypothetical protein
MNNRTVLVYDNGLHVELARHLGKSFDRVLYYSPWKMAFPRSASVLVGSGIEGVERVNDFWDVMKEVDLFVFPDLYEGDLQEYLREEGKDVWGSGRSQIYELDRWKMRELQKELGMPTPKTRLIKGLEKLITLVEKEEDLYIKINTFRGDMETFHHVKYELSKPWLDELAFFLGPRQYTIEFIVENGVEGVETGWDGYLINGKLPPVCSYGYEIKDAGFVGRVTTQEDIPPGLVEVTEILAPHLSSLRGFFSTECRVTEEGEYYMIDPCIRAPSPPSEAYQVVYENLPEVIESGAAGQIEELKGRKEYFALIVLESPWVENNWLAVEVPKEHRDAVKLRNLAVVEGVTYCAPLKFTAFGLAVGLGDSMEAAVKDCLKVAMSVEAYQFDAKTDALQEASEVVAKGEKFGISF